MAATTGCEERSAQRTLQVAVHIAVLAQPESWYFRDLARAATDVGCRCTRLDFSGLTGGIVDGQPVLRHGETNLRDFQAVIIRSMPAGSLEQVVFRMDVLARLEAIGIPVVNPPKALECAIDKYLTTARLAADGLPVPDTIVCEDPDAAMLAWERLDRDVVVKPVFGAEGRGILRLTDPDLAWRTFRTLYRLESVLYLQRFIVHPGYDLRVLVLGDRILGGMRRSSPDDFRVNVARSGIAEPHIPTDHEAELALAATRATGNLFAGIDLLYDAAGRCYVIEVNGVPGWQAFGRVNSMDVAAVFVKWLAAEESRV